MKFHVVTKYPGKLDAIVARVIEGEKKVSSPLTKALDQKLGGAIKQELERRKYKTKAGQTFVVHAHGKLPASHVIVLVVNRAPWKTDHYRRSSAELVKAARSHHLYRIGDDRSGKVYDQETLAAITEGALLGDYAFNRHRSNHRRTEIEYFLLPGRNKRGDLERGLSRGRITAEAQILARDLANEPPSHLTPKQLAKEARAVARKHGLGISVLGPAEMRRAGLGAILAVAKGSDEPPQLIKLTYRPRGGASGGRKKPKHVVLVGKSVTYDSGGINIKPSRGGSLESMKLDMSGGAAVLGAMSALKRLGVKHAVTGYLPATENLLGGSAYKPGDVVKTFNGKTIEVGNTDAEGRLTLADALAYAVAKDKPDEIIDLATLTATDISLGPSYAAIFSTKAALENRLEESGQRTGEKVWPLPFPSEYDDMTKSEVADFSNVVSGRAYTLSGPLLLKHFVGKTPWVHLDIGGPAEAEKDSGYVKKGGSGFGTRLLLEYLSNG